MFVLDSLREVLEQHSRQFSAAISFPDQLQVGKETSGSISSFRSEGGRSNGKRRGDLKSRISPGLVRNSGKKKVLALMCDPRLGGGGCRGSQRTVISNQVEATIVSNPLVPEVQSKTGELNSVVATDDSDIVRCNEQVIRSLDLNSASKFIEIGKELGVGFEGKEMEALESLIEWDKHDALGQRLN
jgi:hypothetical protein